MSTCTSYRPGHRTHYVQARMARSGHPVTLARPRGGLFDVTLPDGTVETWWHHDADAVTRACTVGSAILARPGPLLRIPQGGVEELIYPAVPPRGRAG